jgi:hypothetical protein
MTECCNEWGQCTQGRDCPARTGVVLPHQARHAKRIGCESCAPEGGNVWFADVEPDAVGPWDQIALYAVTGIALLALVITLAGGIGWLAMRFA